jgi:hypothetical protein
MKQTGSKTVLCFLSEEWFGMLFKITLWMHTIALKCFSEESRDQRLEKRNCWEWKILKLLSWMHNIYIIGFFQLNGICRNDLNRTDNKTCRGIHNFNIIIIAYKLLTCQFRAKASKAYGKCLKSWEWQPIIHGESILAYLPKLEEDSILISSPSWLALVHSCN